MQFFYLLIFGSAPVGILGYGDIKRTSPKYLIYRKAWRKVLQ